MWRPACATRVAGIVHWMPTRRAGGTAGSRRHSDSWFAQEGLVTTERADAADGATIPGGTREHDLVGDVPIFERSVAMRSIGATIGSIADTDATVLLRGESGVGKDLVARAIHARSARREGPFARANGGRTPPALPRPGWSGYGT